MLRTAPQDEEKSPMASKDDAMHQPHLILRSPRSGRLEGPTIELQRNYA